MATVIKVKERHRHTANEFERWLAHNPDASLKRKVHAFNAIADSDYRTEKETKKVKKAKPPTKKPIRRI